MGKIFLFILLTASLLFANNNVTKDQYIFLGNNNLAPIIYLKDSNPDGIFIDLTKAIAKKSDLNINIKLMNWDKAQSQLLDDKADALLQINSIKEREKEYDFSIDIFKSDFCIFRRYDRNDIQDIKSLIDLKVGVENKSYPKLILKKYPKINIKTLKDIKKGFKLIEKGELDAMVLDKWVGEYILATSNVKDIIVLNKPIKSNYSKIAVKKGNKELLKKINQGII